MLNEQKDKNTHDHSAPILADESHPLTAETIRKVRDELPEICCQKEDVQKNTEVTSSESVCIDPATSNNPEFSQNIPEWNSALFEEQNSSDAQDETPHNTEEMTLKIDGKLVTFQIDAKSDEFATKYEFEDISSKSVSDDQIVSNSPRNTPKYSRMEQCSF